MPAFFFDPPYGAMSRQVSGSSVNLDTGAIAVANVWSVLGENILISTVGDGWLALPGETMLNGVADLRLSFIDVAANAFFGYALSEIFIVVHLFTLDLRTVTDTRFATVASVPIGRAEAPFIGFHHDPAHALNIMVPFSRTFPPLASTHLFGIQAGVFTRCSAAVGASAAATVRGVVTNIRGSTS